MATKDTLNHCIVFLWLKDIFNQDIGVTNLANLAAKNLQGFKYGNTIVAPFEKFVAFDSNGFAQLDLVETQTPGQNVVFSIYYLVGKTSREIKFKPVQIPNQGNANLLSFAEIAN